MFALTLSCVAQLPLDVVPPPGQPPFRVAINPTYTPLSIERVAVQWIGEEYLVAWRDTRRQSSAQPSRTSVFVSRVRSGGPTFSGGSEVPGSVGLSGFTPALVSTRTFSWLVAPVQGPDGGAHLYGWKGGVDTWDGGWEQREDLSLVDVAPDKTAAAANDTEAIAVWASTSGLHGYRTSGARFTIDAGALTNLSAGGIDGGFLVSWLENSQVRVVRISDSVEPASTLTTNASQASAITSPSHELVVVTGPQIVVHRATPSWMSQPYQTTQGLPTFATSTLSTLGIVASMPGNWEGRFVTPSNVVETSAPFTAPDSGAVVGLGGRLDDDRLLVVTRAGLQLRAMEYTTVRSAGLSSPLNTLNVSSSAPSGQRNPSVIWFDPLDRFLLAWEEAHLDGGTSVLMSQLAPGRAPSAPTVLTSGGSASGIKPVLLRAPAGGRFGVDVSSPGGRQVWALGADAGVVVKGAPLTNLSNLPNAVLGDVLTARWSTNGLIVQTDLSVPINSAEGPPRCVAAANGKLWFVTSGSMVHSINESNGLSTPLMNLGLKLHAPCAAVESGSSIFVAAANDAGLVEFASFAPATTVTLGNRGSAGRPDDVSIAPVVVPMDGGMLAAWAWANANGASLGWVTGTSTVLVSTDLGGADLSSLSLASNQQARRSSPGSHSTSHWVFGGSSFGTSCPATNSTLAPERQVTADQMLEP